MNHMYSLDVGYTWFMVEIDKITRSLTTVETTIYEHTDAVSSEIMEQHGVATPSIPAKNTLTLNHGEWPDELGKDAGGVYIPDAQLILVEEVPVRMQYAKSLLHELIHFKSHIAMQDGEVSDPKKDQVYVFDSDYRVGLTIKAANMKDAYFLNLNEAITEELVKRFSKKLFDDPLFAQEKEDFHTMKQANQGMKEEGETDQGIPVMDDPDLVYVNLYEPEDPEAKMLMPDRFADDSVLYAVTYAYPKQREVLRELVQKIYARNEDAFADADAVFDEFARASLSGNLLPLGKLVDETFGAGTFRNIIEADADIHKLQQIVKGL